MSIGFRHHLRRLRGRQCARQIDHRTAGRRGAWGGQKEIQSLVKALYELPARRRKILIAARLEEAPHLEISQRFGISTRMVEKEIKAALGHCAKRLERKVIQRFGPGPENRLSVESLINP